ncbi:MAG: histidinol-phosphate transaminase [Nitrospiraceae bacterium]|nr:histidinol-phosphate transaminase [Nitrospiraceae bacterium]
MIQPPDYVLDIQPYIPGKPLEELERELGISNSVKLASNENPVGPSPAALRAVQGAFADIHRYPDGAGYYLKQALAKKLGVAEDALILGNGSNELLDIAVRTFMKQGDDAVMAAPSFVVYAMAVRSVGGRPIQVPLKDFTHDLGAMADAITPATKMVFIANPNNPTGTINTREEFDRLMARVTEEMLVVVDEAYYEYVTDGSYADSMKHLCAGKNLLILRTFSKIYGLAGLRIGYGIGRKEVLNDMNRIREPFNTNTIAQRAALAALADDGHVSRSLEVNEKGRQYLYRELGGMGFSYVPTHANFIYMPVDDAPMLYSALLKKGVIIRPMGPKAIRVTIGLPEENFRFIDALKETKGIK